MSSVSPILNIKNKSWKTITRTGIGPTNPVLIPVNRKELTQLLIAEPSANTEVCDLSGILTGSELSFVRASNGIGTAVSQSALAGGYRLYSENADSFSIVRGSNLTTDIVIFYI